MFPHNLYVDAVKKAYNLTELVLSEDDNSSSIVSRVEKALQKTGINNLEKWRPALVLTEWIRTVPEKFPDNTIKSFESLFKDINRSWSDQE